MAIIHQLPTSGSIGAVTHSRGRSGQIIRQRAIPSNPKTIAQIAARSRLGSMAAGWRGLTEAQRAAWNAFSQSFTATNALGSVLNLTGMQCYVKVNTVNLLQGAAVVSAPPALPAFAAVTVTSITAAAGAATMTLVGAPPATGTDFLILASGQRSAGVSYENDFRYIGKSVHADTYPFSIVAVYTAKYGVLIAGKKIFVRIVQNQSGMEDHGTIFSIIVSA